MVCPTDFRLGAEKRIRDCQSTEGLTWSTSTVLLGWDRSGVINKVDLAPLVGETSHGWSSYIHRYNPKMPSF